MKRSLTGIFGLIYAGLAMAGPEVIIPSKAVDNLFYLYKNYSVENEKVNVVGQDFKRTAPRTLTHDETGKKATISFDSFSFYRYLGASVFRAQTGSGTASGTASLIGKNLVLTNKHVLSTDNEKKSCGKFTVFLDDNEKHGVSCKKVWYCDTQDFCLAEMNQHNGKDLSDIVRPLSLRSKEETKAKKLIIVGNAFGLGIQGSSGKDYQYVKKGTVAMRYRFDENVLVHHTPTLSGSSGSPVFNENGAVVGLNYANVSEKGYVDEDAFNMAVPSPYILSQLKKSLPKEVYDNLSIDEEISSDTLRTYRDELEESFEIQKNIQISSSLIIESLLKNKTNLINDEIKKQTQSLQSRLTQFSIRELDYLSMAAGKNSEIEEVDKLNNSLGSFYSSFPIENACTANKDLTLECKATGIYKTINHFEVIKKIGEEESKKIITARYKLKEASQYEVLDLIKKDQLLQISILKKCLLSTNKISRSGDIVFYGGSSAIYYENSNCQEAFISEAKLSGIKWNSSFNTKEFASLAGANTIISSLERSFEKDVASKWSYGLLGKSGTKQIKVENNKSLIEAWIKTFPGKQDVESWFEIINPKMRKSIL